MQVFVVYAPEDGSFVQRLATNLKQHQIDCVLAATDSQAEIEAFQETHIVIIALSMAAAKDARVLTMLDTAIQYQKRVIALRIGPIEELPKALRGVLPLDFSDEDLHEENIFTLLEDLTPPPPPPTPVLPPELQAALSHEDAMQRKRGIEQLGMIRHQLDADLHEIALQTLRDIAFKDPEAMIKALAHNTLQLFSSDTDTSTETIEPIEPPPMLIEPDEPPSSYPGPATDTPPPLLPIWATSPWRLSALMGVGLALLHAYIGQDIAVGLPIGLVWIVLPWLNIAIRDNGRLEWKMPGPLIGNIGVALVLGLVGVGVGVVVGNLAVLDIIALLALSVLYGGLIGWLSTLYSVG